MVESKPRFTNIGFEVSDFETFFFVFVVLLVAMALRSLNRELWILGFGVCMVCFQGIWVGLVFLGL